LGEASQLLEGKGALRSVALIGKRRGLHRIHSLGGGGLKDLPLGLAGEPRFYGVSFAKTAWIARKSFLMSNLVVV
jgi:hypothetical protein